MKSILSKLWLGITALVLIMLLIIWLFQIGLLNEFYIRERQQVLMEEAEKLRTIMLEAREFNTVTYEMVEEVHRFTSSINAFVQIINVQNQSLFMNTPGRYFINDRESDRFERKGPPHLWEDKAIVPYIAKGEPFAIHRIRTRAPESSIVVGVPVYDGEELVANIVITSALAPIEEAITILKKQLSIISILSLGIGTLLALFLAKFFVKPIV
ncbi:MAG: hypothetical protein AB2421_05340, partial [Thermotaleaceae bacterium]